MTNEEIVRQAYRKYLHREPSAAEIKAQIDEALRRGESVEDWIRRIATHFGDTDTANVAGSVAGSAGRGAKPPEHKPLLTPSKPSGGTVQYENPWDPVIQDLKAQHPDLSDGEIWAMYTEGNYTPQAWYPENPFTPVAYVPLTDKGIPDYSIYAPAGTGPEGALDPTAAARNREITRQTMQMAKIVPGAAPDVGVLPDGTTISLVNFQPMEVDEVTTAFAKLALKNPNVPFYWDVKDEIDINGRGYILSGDPSPEEQELIQRFLGGDVKAAGPLAQARMKRLAVTPKAGHLGPTFDQIMKGLTLAFIGTGAGLAYGPVFGPLLGGAFGSGVTNLIASDGDWRQAGIGAASGLAGGAAGGAGNVLGGGGVTGGILGGAAGGLTSAGTRAGLTAGFGGEVNPWDIVVSALSGAAGGGLTAGLTGAGTQVGSDPGGIGEFNIPPEGVEKMLIGLSGKGAGSAVMRLMKTFLPEGYTGFLPNAPTSPFPSAQTMQSYRNAELERARAEMIRRLEEYNAARNAAMDARNAKIAEFKRLQAEALDRLRKQALEFMEKARAQMGTPLPPVPVLQGSPTPPPPDPFEPSQATKGQTFSGDFPVTQSSEVPFQQQQGNPAPETTAVRAKTDMQRLPLNILQIQAALGRRR